MYTNRNQDGIASSYASEPEIYFAEFPSPDQQRQYAVKGAIAFILVAFTCLMACAAS